MVSRPSIGIIMGSQSDWATLKAAADMLGLKRTTLSAKVRSLEPVACN